MSSREPPHERAARWTAPQSVANPLQRGIDGEEPAHGGKVSGSRRPRAAHPLVVFFAPVDEADLPPDPLLGPRAAVETRPEDDDVPWLTISAEESVDAAVVEGARKGGDVVDVAVGVALDPCASRNLDGDRDDFGEVGVLVGILQGTLAQVPDSIGGPLSVRSDTGGSMTLLCTRLSPLVLCALAVGLGGVAGCDGETGFSKAADPPMTEEGAGDIDVQPAEIIIEDIDWEEGIAKGRVVTIANVGDNTLRVLDVSLTSNGGGALYLEEVGELTLAPGSATEFSIIATLTAFEPVESTLRIQSGDVDEANLSLPVVAVPLGYDYVPGESEDTGDTGSH